MITHGNKVAAEDVVKDVQQHVGYFVPDPHLALGDTDSAHGVLFGELAGAGPVAVKPHQKLGRAELERNNLEQVMRVGFDSLEPLQVAAGSLAAYLVTRRRGGIRHLGQMNWEVNDVLSRDELNRVVIPTLGNVAVTLAAWHGSGVFHGDAQAKNMAYDAQGNAIYIDAEKTQFHPNQEMSAKLANKDVALFGLSTLARGLLRDRSPSYRSGFLRAHLLGPYTESMKNKAHRVDTDQVASLVQARWEEATKHGYVPRWMRHK